MALAAGSLIHQCSQVNSFFFVEVQVICIEFCVIAVCLRAELRANMLRHHSACQFMNNKNIALFSNSWTSISMFHFHVSFRDLHFEFCDFHFCDCVHTCVYVSAYACSACTHMHLIACRHEHACDCVHTFCVCVRTYMFLVSSHLAQACEIKRFSSWRGFTPSTRNQRRKGRARRRTPLRRWNGGMTGHGGQ